MSSAEENIINTLVQSMQGENKPEAYDTGATITRIEDGMAWVHIPGGVDETPVKLTIAAEVGDEVQVRVSGGSAFLVGNATAPPTDDKVAKKAQRTADRALSDIESQQNYFWHDSEGAHISGVKESATTGHNTLIDKNGIKLRSGEKVISSFTTEAIDIGSETEDPETGELMVTNPYLAILNALKLIVTAPLMTSAIIDDTGIFSVESTDNAGIHFSLGDVNLTGSDLKWNGTSLISQISGLSTLLSGAILVTSKQVVTSSMTIQSGGALSTLTVACDAISGYTPVLVTPRNPGHNAGHFRILYLDGTDIKVSIGNASASAITISSAYVNVLYVKSELIGSPAQTLSVSQDPSTGVLSFS